MPDQGVNFKANNQHLHEVMKLKEAMEKLVEASEIIKGLYNNGHFLSSEDSRNCNEFLEKSLQMINCLEKSAEDKLSIYYNIYFSKRAGIK